MPLAWPKRFPFYLFQDGWKTRAQEPLRGLLEANPLFSIRRKDLESLQPEDKSLIQRLVRVIKQGFRELIDALDSRKYPMTRTYLENFSRRALLFFDYWLEGKGWIPLTTNTIETSFSRVVNRIKRVGRRWIEQGLLNWLMLAMRKIFCSELRPQLWNQYLKINRHLKLTSLKVEYQWL